VLFVSYPKSGRTWVRFMVDSYLADLHGISVANVFEVERRLDPRWRIEWTHLTGQMTYLVPFDQLDPADLPEVEGRPCVFLTRDVHATLASAYFQASYRINVFSGSPSEFVRSPLFGIRKLVAFYNLMADLRDRLASFTVLTYHSLRQDAAAGLRSVLEVLGAEIDGGRVERAVETGRFESLRRLARTPEYANTLLSPSDPGNPDSDKVRRGDDEAWRELFGEEDLRYIAQAIAELQHDAGLLQYRPASPIGRLGLGDPVLGQ
jgi:hypothetical protein